MKSGSFLSDGGPSRANAETSTPFPTVTVVDRTPISLSRFSTSVEVCEHDMRTVQRPTFDPSHDLSHQDAAPVNRAASDYISCVVSIGRAPQLCCDAHKEPGSWWRFDDDCICMPPSQYAEKEVGCQSSDKVSTHEHTRFDHEVPEIG